MRKLLAVMYLALMAASAGAETIVFSSDFDAAIAGELSPGVATLTPVEGFAGLGPTGNAFGGSFLRSPTGNTVTLSLSGLPAHDTISLGLLFAAIDSLDGTGTFPSGDFLTITLDGTQIFRESFANALASQVQSYVPPAGMELARRVDLGFGGPGGFFTDSAYNFAADSAFADLRHTAATATFTFLLEGPGIQPLSDESWAMDNLRVSVEAATIPEPTTAATLLAGLAIAACRRPRLCSQFTSSAALRGGSRGG